MNEENTFSNTDTNENPGEQPDVLNEEPTFVEEYPSVGNYDRNALAEAIREARD